MQKSLPLIAVRRVWRKPLAVKDVAMLKRDVETALRFAGWSKSQATQTASLFYSDLRRFW